MKRLLCIVSGMNAGGAETFLMKVYRAIDRTKFQMDFAVNVCEKGFYDDEIISMGGNIYHFPSKSESFVKYVKSLRKIIKENDYNYVLRITSNAIGFLDLAIAKYAGAKVCIARSSNSSDGNSLKAKIAHFVGQKLLKKYVDVKIAPSTDAAVYTFGKKDVDSGFVCILPNGLDLNYFKYSEDNRKVLRRKLGLEENDFVIGHVGRFNRQKNHLFLLEIFKRLRESKKNAVLMLVGSGELEPIIQKKVASYGLQKFVHFVGVRSDMPSLYSAMDVLVFPSLYEGMPNAVLEAQACGLPCIVSDTITTEVNVVGNLKFLSLKDVEIWKEKLLGNFERMNGSEIGENFYANGYDVTQTASFFEKVIEKYA